MALLTGTILGTKNNDIIDGGDSFDIIDGMGGNDIINGGPSVDYIDGGPGSDILIQALGDAADGWDTIWDFTPGQDKIALVGLTKTDSFEDIAPHIETSDLGLSIRLSASEGQPGNIAPLFLSKVGEVTADDFEFHATTDTVTVVGLVADNTADLFP